MDLHTLAREHVEDWKNRFDAEGRTIALSGAAPVPALVSPGGLGQALDVLIDNARKHGAGTVSVGVRTTGDHGEITVADEGPPGDRR